MVDRDQGYKYQLSVTAYLASLLSKNETVKDYYIFREVKELEPFDNIVLAVRYNDSEDFRLYLVHVKSAKVKLSEVNNNYWTEYKQITENKRWEKCLANGRKINEEDIQFWYFACQKLRAQPIPFRKGKELEIRRRTLNDTKLIINENVYELFSNDDVVRREYQDFFKQFYIFLEQIDTNTIAIVLKEMWALNDAAEVIEYLDKYFTKNKRESLRKTDFEHELLRIRLWDSIVEPTKITSYKEEAANAWNDLTLSYNVTIVNELDIETCLFGCISRSLDKQITVEQWNAFVDNDGKLSKDIKDKFTSKSHNLETLKDLLVYLWRCGRIPLVLKSNSALPQLKDFLNLNQHYIIIDSKSYRRYNEMESYNLTAIENLEEEDTRVDQLLQSVLVSMQGRRPVSLYTIINGNEELKQTFTFSDILKLMEPRRVYINKDCLEAYKYTLFINEVAEPELSNYEDYDPNGDSISIYCDFDQSTEVYKKLKQNLKFKNYNIYRLRLENDKLKFLGKCAENKFDDDFQGLVSFQIDQYGKSVYRINEDHAVPIIGEVTKMNCLKYLRRYMRKRTNRNGYHSTIKFSETVFPEEHFLKELDRKICVVTGEAGVGKTTFLQALIQTCDSQYYLFFYNLAQFEVDTRENTEKLVKDPLKFLWSQQAPSLYKSFLNMLRNERQRLIVILDSFDEVIPTCKEEVLELIKKLNCEACLKKIIIGSRLLSVQSLTNQFKIEVRKIEEFSNEYNGHYLENWNLDEDGLQEMPTEFIKNPLYLNMLQTISETSGIDFRTITRWTLYNRMVDSAIERYSRRIKHNIDDSERKHVLSFHWRSALKFMFGNNHVTEKYAQEDQVKFTNATRLGMMKYYDAYEDPLFVHHTFAEFFVAQWLIETTNRDDAKFIYGIIVRSRKYLLDIYSEEIPLHKTVLNADDGYDLIIEEIAKLSTGSREVLLQTDLIGRTVLHVVASRYSGDSDKCLDTIIRYMREEGYDLYLRDNLLNWTWIDYCENFSKTFILAVPPMFYATHAAYWRYYASSPSTRSIDFSTYWYFHEKVIKYHFVDILDNLLLVTYFKNKNFKKFRSLCLNTESCIVELPKYFELYGFKLKPIHLAVIYSNINIVNACVKRGDDINVVDHFQCTPLYYSVWKQNSEIVRLLLKRGAGKRREYSRFSTFQLSLQIGNKHITKLLIEAKNLKIFGSVWLRDAIKFGDIEVIALLIEAKVEPTVRENQNSDERFIREIRYRNALKAIKQCCAYNYDVSAMPLDASLSIADALCATANDYLRVTYLPLHTAIHARRNDIVQLLLKKGVNVIIKIICSDDANTSEKETNESTPLCCAVRSWNIDVVELLLQYGADVNYVGRNGLTPLKIAIRNDVVMYMDGGSNAWARWLTIKGQLNEDDTNISKDITRLDWSLCKPIFADRRLQLVEVLLRHGADVNFRVEGDVTPLDEALNERNWSIVEMLLLYGANPNDLKQWDFTRLLAILPTENIKIVELLLKNGANPNFKTVCDVTPLYVPARTRNPDMVKLLMEYGASTDIITCNHMLLDKAKYDGTIDDITWLLELGEVRFVGPIYDAVYPVEVLNLLQTVETQADINFVNEIDITCNGSNVFWINTLLLYAAELTNPNGVKYLKAVLELRKPEVDQILLPKLRYYTRKSPVDYAAEHRNKTVIEILTRNGQGVNSIDEFGRTALVSVIISSGDKSVIRFLLENQADVNLADKDSNTPLIIAIRKRNIDIIKILLEYKAKVNYVEKDGLTPLIAAINTHNAAITGILLDNGADVNFVCESGVTPLYVAILVQNKEIINILRVGGAADIETCGDTLLYNAIKAGHYDIIRILFTRYDIDEKDVATQSVFRNRADVNPRYDFCSAPLHLATQAGYFNIISYLLWLDADTNQIDEDGRTALHYAVEINRIDIIRELLKHKADVNMKDCDSLTPINYANINCNSDIIHLLEKEQEKKLSA